MAVAANIVVGLIAALHVYILVLEMFLWTSAAGMRVFRTEPVFARATATMAANQGLYNGFLAAGLGWGLVAPAAVALPVKVFFLVCVLVAGLYGAVTVNRRIALFQSVPALVGLVLLYASR